LDNIFEGFLHGQPLYITSFVVLVIAHPVICRDAFLSLEHYLGDMLIMYFCTSYVSPNVLGKLFFLSLLTKIAIEDCSSIAWNSFMTVIYGLVLS